MNKTKNQIKMLKRIREHEQEMGIGIIRPNYGYAYIVKC